MKLKAFLLFVNIHFIVIKCFPLFNNYRLFLIVCTVLCYLFVYTFLLLKGEAQDLLRRRRHGPRGGPAPVPAAS